jgi:hypothetical protein
MDDGMVYRLSSVVRQVDRRLNYGWTAVNL